MSVQGVTGNVITYGGNWYSLRFLYDQKYDIETNTSVVTFTAQAYHGSDAFTYVDGCVYVNGNLVKKWNAKSYPDGSVDPNGNWATISNGVFSVNIPHNQDGTCSFTLSIGGNNWGNFLFVNDAYSYTHDSFSGNWNVTLETIPRASSFSKLNNATIGSTCNIQWIPNSTRFSYKLKFMLGSWSSMTDAISPGITSEYTYTGYTIPMEVINQLPNSITGTMTVIIYTYTNSSCTVQLGSESSSTFIVSVPNNVIPTISSVIATIDNSKNSVIKGWDIAVSGYTKVNLTAICNGVYGSSIISFTITGAYSATVSGSILNWTGNVITSPGDKSFIVRVTDSRGRVSESYVSNVIYFYPYTNPTINLFSGERLENEQNKVNIFAQWSISSVGDRNDAIYELKYKKSTQSTWTTYDGVIENGETAQLSIDYDTSSSFNFKLIIRDSIGNFCQQECMISTMSALLDFKSGGKGLGIGKVCESDSMEVSLPAIFLNSVCILVGTNKISLADYIKGVVDGIYT